MRALPRYAFDASPSNGSRQLPGEAGSMLARMLLLVGTLLVLSACGFQLRQAPNFAFASIVIVAPDNSALANELRRNLQASDRVQVLPAAQMAQADVLLDLLADERQKVVVGLNASGQVREFQLRTRLQFRLRSRAGRELIAPTDLTQQRDISFSESAVLAKEAEEQLLFRDMQSDIVQQLMRRLAAVRSL